MEVEVLGLDEVIEVITENLRLKSLSQHFEESDKCISFRGENNVLA